MFEIDTGEEGQPGSRSLSFSHGEEADRIRSGQAASALSSLASTTALFLESRRAGVDPSRLITLHARARRFIGMLEHISESQQLDRHQLPYRQLLPRIVWEQEAGRDRRFKDVQQLATQVREAVETTEQGPSIGKTARLLADLAARLEHQAAAALMSRPR